MKTKTPIFITPIPFVELIKEETKRIINGNKRPILINQRYQSKKISKKYTKTEYIRYHMFVHQCFCWIDPNDILPGQFDLVNVIKENGELCHAWYTGSCWDGYLIDPSEKIIAWHRTKDFQWIQ